VLSLRGVNYALVLVFLLGLVCYMVFRSSNLFFLYLAYEVSLVPIVLIIVIWGSYPERSLSSLMLLIYTSVFTFPFIFVLFYLYSSFRSFALYQFSSSVSFFMSVVVFFVFCVKLPVYGLHF
jgi:NADH:ubiquinone oxidoreductase subunit 4 (subunit M)